MTFLQPGYLWLAPVALLFWFWPRRSVRRQPWIRTALWAVIVLALAEPVWTTDDARAHHVLVLDQSDSLGDQGRDAARDLALRWSNATAGAQRTLVVFGGSVTEEMRAWADDAVVAGRPDGSPLGAALDEAARRIPQGASASVTVVTDGRATDGAFALPLAALSDRGIPVHTTRIEAAPAAPHPLALEILGDCRVGHAVRGRIRLAGTGADATVRLRVGDEERVSVAGVAIDGAAFVPFEFEPKTAGFQSWTVEVIANGATRARTWPVAVQDPLAVLYAGRAAGAAEALRKLVGPGFDVREAELGGWEGADLVVVDDLPADRFPEDAQRELREAVRDRGLGVFASGGAGAFGPGGYHDTPFSEMLPVAFVQKEEKRDPSTTLVVIIDTSGSMGGTRVQLAKEVARLAIRRLLPHDKVGLVEFYGAKRWAAPIQPASNSIEIQRALNRLDAGGGTVIMPAIEEAYYALQNVQTRFKHVLVLTDGGVEQGAFEPLLRKMAQKGINVSSVLVGAQAHSEFLVSMANWGKGRFYAVPDRFNLPEILLKQPTTARLPAYRRGDHRVRARGGRGWWGRVAPDSMPPLDGYVELRSRTGAEVLVETRRGNHPVVATWRYGLGRVTTLATEPVGPGSTRWQSWEDYGAWLARVWARSARRVRPPFRWTIRRHDHRVEVEAARVAATAPAWRDAEPRARLLGAQPRALEFARRADGVFVASAVVDPAVEARVQAHAQAGPRTGAMTRLVAAAHAGRAPETMVDPAAAFDIEAAATETGGTSWTPSAGAPAARAGETRRLVELSPWLALLAVLLLFFELYDRRRSRSPEAV